MLIAEAQPILSQNPSTSALGKAISHFQQAVIWSRVGMRSAALAANESGLAIARQSVDIRHPLMTIARRTALGVFLHNQELQKAQLLCEETISQLKGMPPSYELCEAKGELAHVLAVKGDQESVFKAADLALEVSEMLDEIKLDAPREFGELVDRIAEELAAYDTDRAAAFVKETNRAPTAEKQ
jgi:hypothetical protein